MRQPVWLRRHPMHRLGIWAVAFACGLGWAAWAKRDKSEKPVGIPWHHSSWVSWNKRSNRVEDRGIESNMNRWRRYAAMK